MTQEFVPPLEDAATRRRRLTELLRQKVTAGADVPIPTRWDLTVGQEAMWFLQEYSEDSTPYTMGEAVTLHGSLDVACFRRAVTRLGRRHPVLTTVVDTGPGGQLQQVTGRVELELVELDARNRSEEELSQLLSERIDAPFTLAAEPPVRIELHQRAVDEHVALLCIHHLVGDFATLVLLIRDLVELYRSEVVGSPAVLPTLTAGPQDHVAAQRRYLASPAAKQDWQFWREELSAAPPAPAWPELPPVSGADRASDALRAFEVPENLGAALTRAAISCGCTTYQFALAVYAVFLSRHLGQHNVVVGTPMTSRTDPRWRDAVGYFLNTLPVRVRIDEEQSVRDLVQGVQRTVAGAFEHQALPFAHLVEGLRRESDLESGAEASHASHFETTFVLRRAQVDGLEGLAAMGLGGSSRPDDGRQDVVVDLGAGLRAEARPVPRRTAQFPLALSLAESPAGLTGGWEFDPARFSSAAVDAFTARFLQVLADATGDVEAPVHSLRCSVDDDAATVSQSGGAQATADPDRVLHQRFDVHVDRQPHATAVVDGEVRLSRAALSKIADGIAAGLVGAGAGEDDLVAVLAPCGWQQVAAVLGTSRSGAAYLPVDPALPDRRVAELLRLGGVRHVLTTSDARARLPEGFSGFVHEVSTADAGMRPMVRVRGGALAYVIYTSGSTGVPKGVMIEHAAACATLDDLQERLALGPADRVLAVSSLSFDLSVFDVFGVLGAGGTVVVPPPAADKDPVAWAGLVAHEGVTVWNSVPALAGLLVEAAQRIEGSPLQSLRHVMLSGDWIPLSLPPEVAWAAPQAAVLSLGGATEASIWSICHPIDAVLPHWRSIPYGRPLTAQSFHVFDDRGRPVPAGVVGELHIGGAGLARGYHDDPQRTRDAFWNHPRFGRLYRTGDLGRRWLDGTIEFLGRRDQQVKINGFRVETGEAEAALRELEGVAEAVVVADTSSGAARLCAFVRPVPGVVVDEDAVRAELRDRLPAHVVPSVVRGVASWPLTVNGKVDVAVLSRLLKPTAAAGSGSAGTDGWPGGPGQRPEWLVLREAVREVLPKSDPGRADSFLDLGGDSVAAIRVVMRVQEAGYTARPETLLIASRLDEVADALSPSLGSPGAPDAASPAGTGPLPLTPMQRTMFLHAVLSDVPGLYCEHVVVRCRGLLDVPRLQRAWGAVLGRHPLLRCGFGSGADGELQQTVAAVPTVPIEVVRLDERTEAEVLAEVVEADRARGFDLASPPLMRWTVVTSDTGEHVLVWAHHHLVLDGWSLPLVLRDVFDAYGRDVEQLPSAAGAIAVLHERAALEAGGATRQMSHWAGVVENVPDTRVRPDLGAGGPFQHRETELALSAAVTAALSPAAARSRVTSSTLVQAAWALALGRRSHARSVCTGLTVAGRDGRTAGMDTAVGMFINTVPLVVDLAPATPVREWLRAVRDSAFAAAENAGLQLGDVERIATAHHGDARPQGPSLFDSVLVFENFPRGEFDDLGGPLVVTDVDFVEVLGFPLALYAFPGKRMSLRISWDAGRWSPPWVRGLLQEVAGIIGDLVAGNDDRPIAALGGPSTPHDLGTKEVIPEPEVNVLDLVRRAAALGSGRLAICDDENHLTYGQLLAWTQELASRLRAAGAGPESVVLVDLPRSCAAVVAQLAVLWCGASYLMTHLEAADRSKTSGITDDGDLVLTRFQAARASGDLPAVDVGTCPIDPITVPAGRDGEPASVHPLAAAYSIRTSGTTGRPRRVVLPHRALASFVQAAARRYGWGPQDRVLQFATLQFDAAVEEVFVTLSVGATLVLRGETMIDSLTRFLDEVERLQLTVLDLPTSFWTELVDHLENTGRNLAATVRSVVVGGEALPAQALTRWRGRTELLNTYGPTEATVVVTSAVLS